MRALWLGAPADNYVWGAFAWSFVILARVRAAGRAPLQADLARLVPRVAAVVALAAVVVAVVVLVLGRGDDGPGATGPAEAYAAAWTRGDDAAAGALTDAPGRATGR